MRISFSVFASFIACLNDCCSFSYSVYGTHDYVHGYFIASNLSVFQVVLLSCYLLKMIVQHFASRHTFLLIACFSLQVVPSILANELQIGL